MNRIEIVHPNFIAQLWPNFSEMIARALDTGQGEITADQLKVHLIDGRSTLVAFFNEQNLIGCVVYQWEVHPNNRVMFILAHGGASTKEHATQLFDMAKNQGATSVRCCAGKAQARLFKMKYGFKPIYTTMEKTL